MFFLLSGNWIRVKKTSYMVEINAFLINFTPQCNTFNDFQALINHSFDQTLIKDGSIIPKCTESILKYQIPEIIKNSLWKSTKY